MQGKHMVLQLDKKPPASYGVDGDDEGRPDMAVVLRVEALDQEGLLHRLVERIRALCKGQAGYDAPAAGGGGGGAEEGGGGEGASAGGGGARLEQYGLRGHTGFSIMEFLIAGAKVCMNEPHSILLPYVYTLNIRVFVSTATAALLFI